MAKAFHAEGGTIQKHKGRVPHSRNAPCSCEPFYSRIFRTVESPQRHSTFRVIQSVCPLSSIRAEETEVKKNSSRKFLATRRRPRSSSKGQAIILRERMFSRLRHGIITVARKHFESRQAYAHLDRMESNHVVFMIRRVIQHVLVPRLVRDS
jgi:hypothetical protein